MIAAGAVAAVIAAASFDYCQWLAYRGFRLFQSGDFALAVSAWGRMENMPGRREEVAYNSGVAEYRQGHYSTAIKHFRSASKKGSKLRSRSLYNLGTAHIRVAAQLTEEDRSGKGKTAGSHQAEQHLKEAVTALDQALALAPSDAAAQANLGLARKRLAALSHAEPQAPPAKSARQEENDRGEKRAERGEAGKTRAKGGKASDLDQEGGKRRRAPLDRNQALRMLDEAKGRESLRSATASSQEITRPAAPDKDW